MGDFIATVLYWLHSALDMLFGLTSMLDNSTGTTVYFVKCSPKTHHMSHYIFQYGQFQVSLTFCYADSVYLSLGNHFCCFKPLTFLITVIAFIAPNKQFIEFHWVIYLLLCFTASSIKDSLFNLDLMISSCIHFISSCGRELLLSLHAILVLTRPLNLSMAVTVVG